MTKREFISRIQEEVGISDFDEAEKAATIVLNAISKRLTPDESDDVRAQLPTDMKDLWNDQNWAMRYLGALGVGRPSYKSQDDLYVHITNELADNDIEAEPESLVNCVIHCLKEQVSYGEIEDVAAQMPGDVKDLFLSD